MKMKKRQFRVNIKVVRLYKVICLLIIMSIMTGPSISTGQAAPNDSTPARRVNIPYLGTYPPPPDTFTPAIFWFGKVDSTSNYADVRVWYYDDYFKVNFHIIDRRLWYNPAPSPSDLTNWDAVSLYIKLDGNVGDVPTPNTYQFDAQINDFETPRTSWQAVYRGNGSGWTPSSISFTTESGYRWESETVGGVNNDQNNRGWEMNYIVPFASLGLPAKPAANTIWGLGLVLHDRDDQSGTPVPDQTWPETMQANQPSTWGQMHFGVPEYNPPTSIPAETITIRNGLNGAVVNDGAVGGHTTCGAGLWPDIFNTWGQANYAGYDQFNIQNQWDLSDWPCFSKFYITFPLGTIPTSQNLLSATLSMYLFGGSAGPPDSYIQVMTVGEDWNEATLTWNNAPLATENISGTWVHPIESPDWVLYSWDVSRAVAQAYTSGQPLRLAMYSADSDYHTGKYFISSDGEGVGRPTLQIVFGSPCNSPGVTCYNVFLPLTQH